MEWLDFDVQPAALAVATVAAAAVAGFLLHGLLYALLRTVARRHLVGLRVDDELLAQTRAPSRLLFPVLAVYVAAPIYTAAFSERAEAFVGHVLYLLLVLALAWLVVRLVLIGRRVITRHLDLEAEDNLRARQIVTQVTILQRVVVVGIVLLALAAALLRFEAFRQIGTGLLASAGIAGIVVGFAAQRTLGNLIAGFQIAITQPIRVDDVVVVEGEWGRIEEITLTYVVVRIWDLRRLVLPISYFIEKPFQNWTRVSADVLGTVYLHLDYTVPFEAVRHKLHEVLEASSQWDGQVCRLHVTDATERTVQLRCLMSATNSGDLWELRCAVREQMLAWVQEAYPDVLPVVRAELSPDEAGRRSGPPVRESGA
ncbi:MAG: mechanosensitive ion channel [Rhodothermales bacterium]|nr:mechanosensitive ion channel [Rhodothermales bacterium]